MSDQPGLWDDADTPPSTGNAYLSTDGRYRYWLTRTFGGPEPGATFVMLNPSTADADTDDPTIRRCIGFAKAWGYGALTVVNLYAYRATKPTDLWKVEDPVGRNDDWLAATFANAARHDTPLVAAWGTHARQDRVDTVLSLPGADRFTALGVTKDGAPRHPLYMPSLSPLRPWTPFGDT